METLTIYDRSRRQIPHDAIEFIEGDGNYCKVHIVTGNPILLSKTLAKMAERLPGFVRIHKGILVNPSHVVALQVKKQREGKVILSQNRFLSVSRRQAASVLTAFQCIPSKPVQV